MNILVTRPSPAGEQLVRTLRTYGKMAWHMPLINIIPGKDLPYLPQYLSNLNRGDLLFIISQFAINYANSWLKRLNISWPSNLHYYTIGRSTGLRLYNLSNLPAVYPKNGETSENLLCLINLMHINGKQALILRGNGGREILKRTLYQHGVKVIYCECYQRNPIHYDGEEQSKRMQMLDINVIIITSGKMLQQFCNLIPKDYLDTLLLSCQLVVISKRLATLASKLGWLNINIVESADNNTLLRALI